MNDDSQETERRGSERNLSCAGSVTLGGRDNLIYKTLLLELLLPERKDLSTKTPIITCVKRKTEEKCS